MLKEFKCMDNLNFTSSNHGYYLLNAGSFQERDLIIQGGTE